jgi:hypothetical protein
MLSEGLEKSLHRALAAAAERMHEYATLEHLLLGLLDDPDASIVLEGSGVDLDLLRDSLIDFLDEDLAGLAMGLPSDPKPTAGFQRVVQRAAIHVQAAGRDDVTAANVLVSLFSERESHAVYFLQKQDMTRFDAVNFISHGIIKERRRYWVEPPPKLPAQGLGPHVELNSKGVIAFPPAEALDRQGNHIPRLRALHPDLRELARELVSDLNRGNAPHAVLGERVAAYAALIDQDLAEIDFYRLYAAGVRLANAFDAAARAISVADLPQFELGEQEKLNSLLGIHGSFILATNAGAEAIAEEERYRRRPVEERIYRADAIAMAQALQNRPDLIAPEVAEQVLGAAREISQGNFPERSGVAGRAIVRNVLIGVGSAALASAMFVHAAPAIL